MKDKIKVIFSKEYHGFDSCSDISRDISEMWDHRFNPDIKDLPHEFDGIIKIEITYHEQGDL